MTQRYVSLGEFERLHGIHKGTVSKKARELGFDTASGLSPDAYKAMKQEFGVKDRQQTADTGTQPRQPTTYRAGGLVPVGHGIMTRTIGLFDADAYQQDKTLLEQQTLQQAGALNEMVAAYAQSRIAAVLADIDLVADGLRTNALQSMGMPAGKQPTDGGEVA